MKRFFTKKSVALILLFLVLGGFFVFHNVHAAASTGATTATTATTNSGPNYTLSGVWDVAGGVANQDNFVQTGIILRMIVAVLGWFLSFFGSLFDMAINFSIFNIKLLFDSAGSINILWQTLRDTINIVFIFILLYIAITKIIGSWGVKSATTLTNVIIDVIMINFSMFFTKILIDAGNFVAAALYSQIQIISNGNISNILSTSLNIHSFTNMLLTVSLASQQAQITAMVLQCVVIILLMWVFFYGCWLFIGRTVMLMFLAIASPIGFVFGSIPWISQHSKDWWKALTNQILVAPVFLFFLLVVVKLLQNNTLANLTSNITQSDASPVAANMGSYFFYILVIVLLLQGMKLTQKLSGKVGEIAVNVGKTVAVAGAMLATGGLAAGAEGLLGADAAEAELAAKTAGKGKVGQLLARGNNALKNFPTSFGKNVTKVFTGEHTGVAGMASNVVKSNLYGGVKGATGGFVDIDKLLKNNEKNQKENEDKIRKAAEAIGPKKYQDRQKEIEATKDSFRSQAIKSKEVGSSDEKKVRDNSEEKFNKLKEESAKSPNDPQIKGMLDKAKADFDVADKKFKVFIEDEAKRIAERSGKSFDVFNKENEELDEKIIKSSEARNKYISNLEKTPSITLFGKRKQKLTNELWAGNRQDISKAFLALQKQMKEGGYNISSEEKTENEKPDAGGPKATDKQNPNDKPII